MQGAARLDCEFVHGLHMCATGSNFRVGKPSHHLRNQPSGVSGVIEGFGQMRNLVAGVQWGMLPLGGKASALTCTIAARLLLTNDFIFSSLVTVYWSGCE